MLYSFGIEVILLFIRVVALFSKKIAHFLKVRTTSLKKVQAKISTNDRVLWFHCASLGEFEQAPPLLSLVKKNFQTIKLLLHFFRPQDIMYKKIMLLQMW